MTEVTDEQWNVLKGLALSRLRKTAQAMNMTSYVLAIDEGDTDRFDDVAVIAIADIIGERDEAKYCHDQSHAAWSELYDANKTLQDRVRVLEEALRPFDQLDQDDYSACSDYEWAIIHVTIGDLRAAAKAMEGK
jgi:hypothetical protein